MTPTTPERWLPVVGYEGLYEVSDLGRVRSLERVAVSSNGRRRPIHARILARPLNPAGRPLARLSRRGKARSYAVSGLVMRAFVGPTPDGLCICHNNGDPQDNRLGNLRWDSQTGNMQDRIKHGNNPKLNHTHCPHGHQLRGANLHIRKDGARQCLSCRRAQGRCAYRRRQHGEHLDFIPLAREFYRQIMQIA